MTAGRDSIRIYRLKNGQLRGTSVRLVPTDKRVSTERRTVLTCTCMAACTKAERRE